MLRMNCVFRCIFVGNLAVNVTLPLQSSEISRDSNIHT